MMILIRLHLENFKKYTNFDIEFGEGLVGIIGKNGSGKSTIFEAILFALYGEFKSRGYKEIVRNASASTKDAVVVELEFEFDGVEYKVVREFRGKTLSANARLFKNGELIASSAKEVTMGIVALTKMSKEAFMHTLFASQKELTSLSTLSNENRKKMIRKLLGLQKIDFIEKELIEKSRELKREIQVFDDVLLSDDELKEKNKLIAQNEAIKKTQTKELTKKTKELNELRVKELNASVGLEEFTKTKEHKKDVYTQIQLQKNSIDSQSKIQTKLGVELQALEVKAKELKTYMNVKKDYDTLHLRVQEQVKLKEQVIKKDGILREQLGLREQYKKSKTDISVLEKECSPLDALNQEIQKQESAIRILDEKIQTAQTKEREFLSSMAGEKTLISSANSKIKKIQKLGRESDCPTCTRPLLEEYDNVMDDLNLSITSIYQAKIDTLNLELKEIQKEKLSLEISKKQEDKNRQDSMVKIKIIKSKLDDLSKLKEHFLVVEKKGKENAQELKELEGFSYDELMHQGLEKEYKELSKRYKKVLSLETELKRVPDVEKEIKTIAKNIIDLNSKCKEKEKEHKSIKYDELKHQDSKKEYDELQKKRDEKTGEESHIKVELAKLDGETTTVQSLLDSNQKQVKKVKSKKDDLLDYDKIKESLVAFKTRLNAKIAPRISEIASTMYAQITKGKYQHIEVSNEFDFFIYDDGKKYPIERFSGGEIDLANLVLRIAISKTLTELNGATSIGFLAFDEVFGSQDESRRMEILEAFHTIKEQYRQIFLISHEMEIKEMFESVVEL